MTLTVSPALEHDLQHLAEESNSTADELVQQALEEFVAYRRELNQAASNGHQDAFVSAVREGIAAGERGELAEHNEVVTMLNDIVAHG